MENKLKKKKIGKVQSRANAVSSRAISSESKGIKTGMSFLKKVKNK